jgi:hypothetical protein
MTDLESQLEGSVALAKRIKQLEKQCATLAAEVDLLRPVVDAAIEWKKYSLAESDNDELLEAISDYEAAKEQG